MSTNLRFIADLADGSTVVGSYIHIEMTVPEISRAQVCTLTLLSDTHGRLDINAKHIIRIGTDPAHLTETKQPQDVFYYVTDLLRLANENILIYEQTLIACRAFFPNSEKSLHGIMCYKDGHPVVFVEINYEWDGSITYDVWFYPDHSKPAYFVSYDQMCSRLKYLARIL